MFKVLAQQTASTFEFFDIKLPARFYVKAEARDDPTSPDAYIPSPVPERAISNLKVYQNGIKIIDQPEAGEMCALNKAIKFKYGKEMLSNYMQEALKDRSIYLDLLSPFMEDELETEVNIKFDLNKDLLWESFGTQEQKIHEVYAIYEIHDLDKPIQLKPIMTYFPLISIISRNKNTFTFKLEGLVPGKHIHIFPIGEEDIAVLHEASVNEFTIDEISLKNNDTIITYYNYYEMYRYFKKLTGSEIPTDYWEENASFITFKIPEGGSNSVLQVTYNKLRIGQTFKPPFELGCITYV